MRIHPPRRLAPVPGPEGVTAARDRSCHCMARKCKTGSKGAWPGSVLFPRTLLLLLPGTHACTSPGPVRQLTPGRAYRQPGVGAAGAEQALRGPWLVCSWACVCGSPRFGEHPREGTSVCSGPRAGLTTLWRGWCVPTTGPPGDCQPARRSGLWGGGQGWRQGSMVRGPSGSLLGLPGGDVQRRPRGRHVHGEHVHPQLQAALRERGVPGLPEPPSPPLPPPTFGLSGPLSAVSTLGPQEFL